LLLAADNTEEKNAEPEKEKKKKVKKHDLPVSSQSLYMVSPKDMEVYKNVEYEMAVQDRHIKELHARKNDLETYIYNMRDRCSSGDLAGYITQADKDKFMPMLDDMENWLYSDEAETANKSMFIAKLDELKKYGGPAVERAREADERPLAFSELDKTIQDFESFLVSTEERYAHITGEERAKVQEAVQAAKKWSAEKQQEQARRAQWEDPAVKAADIKQKKTGLAYDCNLIRNKPKPVVKEEPKPKADAPPADAPAPEQPAAEPMDMGTD
jgi:hypothetical protein